MHGVQPEIIRLVNKFLRVSGPPLEPSVLPFVPKMQVQALQAKGVEAGGGTVLYYLDVVHVAVRKVDSQFHHWRADRC